MITQFSRTALLLGEEAIERLHQARVAVFGIGGVGGYVCEALVRSGVGSFDLIDNDTVSLTNLNRQIIALHSTVGRYKTEVMKERMLDINPDVKVQIHNCFYLPETAGQFHFEEYDYVVDAVDTVTAKLSIIMEARACQTPVISSMGAGNKLDPSLFRVADIFQTKEDRLARVMRRELKKRGVDHLKVVYSEEKPLTPQVPAETDETEREATPQGRRSLPGSLACVPSAAGLVLAGEVIRDLCSRS
ncbi:MAG: tRNA threonylcarbamoyladenosine dehydratase [Lachnospiraceae bacterium]|nr:tRNA threonylcarbamoyladenosine dehydratase [Lachnospiraceae bacterium]